MIDRLVRALPQHLSKSTCKDLYHDNKINRRPQIDLFILWLLVVQNIGLHNSDHCGHCSEFTCGRRSAPGAVLELSLSLRQGLSLGSRASEFHTQRIHTKRNRLILQSSELQANWIWLQLLANKSVLVVICYVFKASPFDISQIVFKT